MRVEEIHIDEHILDKIESKHGLSFDEVEEAVFAVPRQLRRGRGRLYTLLGRTGAGRYLLVVLAPQGDAVFKVVTARDMDEAERRIYARAGGG